LLTSKLQGLGLAAKVFLYFCSRMSQYQKVAYYTLGCKLNFSETSTIARQLTDAGYARVDFDDRPDIFVINTCSVTENANRKCRQLVSKARKVNPEAKIIIIGCYAQLKPEEISSIPGVSLVLGANEKFNIEEHISDERLEEHEAKIIAGNIKEVNTFIPSFSVGDRTRSFLKIQDGCDYFCSFCTIPLARGKSRSATIAETLVEAQKVAETEVKEVVLTGVNIGDFGVDSDENFYQLIQALDEIEGIDRYRISSIEPNLLDEEIISFVLKDAKRFAPHFHIPLQSGSDTLLASMRRKYESALYAERVEQIKSLNADCCIGVDVIVGYPGETEEEFQKTYDFLNGLDVSYLHVFTYSERPNTGALKVAGKVAPKEREKRSKMLQILSHKKKRAFYESQLGKKAQLLLENEDHDGYIHGFTANYIKVKLPYDPALVNTIQDVELREIDRDGVMLADLIPAARPELKALDYGS
jgi:threonylcarbamoyladenosine tRNA methylthiotransferase MtaB